MHDIRAIRENPAAFDAALARRGLAPLSPELLEKDAYRRELILAAETAQARINALSAEAGAAKKRGDTAAFDTLRAEVAETKSYIGRTGEKAAQMDTELREDLMSIPNLPLNEVPYGSDETGNVEIRRWGSPRSFPFTPVEHFEIAGVKPGMDFETAAKLSGSRFVVLKGAVNRVHRA